MARRRRNPFPLPHEVSIERWVDDGIDDLNNRTGHYAPPEKVMVAGLAPPATAEPTTVGENRVVVDTDMYAPIEIGAMPKDRVVFRGRRYEVIGHQQDADQGPWWGLPMCTVHLKHVEG